jgi:hypothetical protein
LRTEPKRFDDQAPSAILEFVDSPVDMRFKITAAAALRDRRWAVQRGELDSSDATLGTQETEEVYTPLTLKNMRKVTRYRPNGEAIFEDMVRAMADLELPASPAPTGISAKRLPEIKAGQSLPLGVQPGDKGMKARRWPIPVYARPRSMRDFPHP